MQPLSGYRVLVVAVNIPAPVAAARFAELGAVVVKIEPPEGDPLAAAAPEWYASLNEKVDVIRLDLKLDADRLHLEELLEEADLLLTSYRPSSLERLGLNWSRLANRFSRLSQVMILGEEEPRENRPGHDLTYQAQLGLISPPALPRALIADLAGAQEAVIAGLALLLARVQGAPSRCVTVSLKNAAARFAEPLHQRLTAPGGILGGAFPGYNVYRTRDGWVALAAIESRFVETLCREWKLAEPSSQEFEAQFLKRTAVEWEQWAVERDIPLVAVR